uniref:Uncharacterized protein n=1 Tax=Aegilops tauschii TaxID=37682 RepID=M8BL95_AEGTA
MGSVAAAVQEDSPSSKSPELEAAFLERQEARVFLTGLRRRSCSDPGGEEGFFRRYGFCVRELLLHDSRCGLPITTLSSG